MALSSCDAALSSIAIVLTLLIIAETVVVVFVRIDLTKTGVLSSSQRTAYATVTTIIATAITIFVTDCLRRLWVAKIDPLFLSSRDRQRIQGKWRVVLAVGSLREMFQHFEVQITYVIAALITTSIVASLTPTIATQDIRFHVEVASGLPSQCAPVYDQQISNFTGYEWQLPNKSWLSSAGNWDGCPPRQAVTIMSGINIINTSQFAYMDLGVAVKSTAIGAPLSVYGTDHATKKNANFYDIIGDYGSTIHNTTQCVRVMTGTPVSCNKGGSVEVNDNNTITATSEDGRCSVMSSSSVSDPTAKNLMAKRICPKGDPGQATIVLGGINEYAKALAAAINDQNRPYKDSDAFDPGYRYAITCEVDARNVFRYREVILSLQDSAQIQETNLGRQLRGGRDIDCKEFNVDDHLGLLATAVAANWQPLFQNEGADGWFDSISQKVTVDEKGMQPRLRPYAFNNSQNALDDTLGLVIALTTARMDRSLENVSANATVINTRVGSGKLASLAYALPPLITAATLLALFLPVLCSKKTAFSSIQLENLAECEWLRENRNMAGP